MTSAKSATRISFLTRLRRVVSARRLTATSLADTIDLKTALTISAVALGVLVSLRLYAPAAHDQPRRDLSDQLALTAE